MFIEWHIVDGRTEAYTVRNRCCDNWDILEHYLNIQPTGIGLEVPNYVEFHLLNPEGFETDIPIVRWTKLGTINYCPFCGARIIMIKTEGGRRID